MIEGRTLIIGQAPGRSGSGEVLAGRCGRRLAGLCGISLEEYLAAFDRENLLASWPGERSGGGDLFLTVRETRELARRYQRAVSGRRVVVLGTILCCGFDLPQPAFQFVPHWGGNFAWSPHPSGRCRFWNHPPDVQRARAFWTELASRRPSTMAPS